MKQSTHKLSRAYEQTGLGPTNYSNLRRWAWLNFEQHQALAAARHRKAWHKHRGKKETKVDAVALTSTLPRLRSLLSLPSSDHAPIPAPSRGCGFEAESAGGL